MNNAMILFRLDDQRVTRKQLHVTNEIHDHTHTHTYIYKEPMSCRIYASGIAFIYHKFGDSNFGWVI